ncbi:hypothetical protein ATK74_0834 [Propionicimonas paludicola]|uniref:Uncharacterized protein n=1 Tax=Propionicimonas paludicola TaxID=185243 RepID=A0A2A9CRN4_9ACTN|nr:hypothetical protein [Propionicimonas paludicola]PFG16300.1 hypothetical protein ATK74_0834 [Propionicimonas paludicola]
MTWSETGYLDGRETRVAVVRLLAAEPEWAPSVAALQGELPPIVTNRDCSDSEWDRCRVPACECQPAHCLDPKRLCDGKVCVTERRQPNVYTALHWLRNAGIVERKGAKRSITWTLAWDTTKALAWAAVYEGILSSWNEANGPWASRPELQDQLVTRVLEEAIR